MPIHIVQIEGNDPMADVLKIALDAAEPELVLAQFITGDDAISYIRDHAADIDLFILDVRLPGYLTGLQLAAFIRAIHCPGFIVFTSGYGTPKREILNALRSEFIPKPWHIPELTQNLFKYHIEKTIQASSLRDETPAKAITNFERYVPSHDVHLSEAHPVRRAMLSRKVATSECKKPVLGSGLLHKLISKMRNL